MTTDTPTPRQGRETSRTGSHRTWLITGSSRGFGLALAQAALASGDSVVATARQPKQLDALVEHYGDRVLPLTLDVTDSAAAQNAVDHALRHFGALDIVVNKRWLRQQCTHRGNG